MNRNYLNLVLLCAVVVVPLAAAWFLYYNPHLLSGKTTARGDLLIPPLDARPLVGEADQWRMVTLVDNPCSSICRQTLHYSHRAHLALSKDRSRLIRQAVMLNQPDAASRELFRSLDLSVVMTSQPQLHQVFPQHTIPSLYHHIFIIDPHGNLMLQHNNVTSIDAARDLVRDLKKLLRASRIG